MCSFVFVSAETMFKSGSLLASYIGRAAGWQGITIEYPTSGPQPEGPYVLLQQNKNQILEVRKLEAFFEGTAQNFITTILANMINVMVMFISNIHGTVSRNTD